MANKPPFPGCEEALVKYYDLRKRLHSYFFHDIELKISNTQTIMAYSDVYNLIDRNPQAKLQNEKTYQLYEETLFRTFKNDLTIFCREVRENLISKKGTPSPVDELGYYYEWIVHYTWFLRWTHKILSSIQKNIAVFSRTTLYFTGLTIMRDQIIEPLYPDIFRLLTVNLELFKQGQLQQYHQLQFMIQVLGMCGFGKYFCVKLQKNASGFFQFVSTNKQNNQKAEDEYQTDYFLRKFVNEYVKFLKNKYTKMSDEMIQMSTPEYVNKTTECIERQTKAAQFFYSNATVKNIIIRSIDEILIANKCKQLITNPKSGLSNMVQTENAEGLKNLYKLIKRTFQQKLFGQSYQQCIERYISQEILMKITPEDERQAKKEVVFSVMNSLFEYYQKIQTITKSIHDALKDPYDLVLITCQTNGFQMACNKNNTVCTFLAFYCDVMLKKQQNVTDNNPKEFTNKISKMLKFMYSHDQFLKIYQKMLGIRILYDAFKNKDTQMEIINMLKTQVGMGNIAKITTIIQDQKFSENFNSQKSAFFRNKVPFNFQVILLTSGAWQIQDLKNGTKLVPPQLMKAVDIFEQQYKELYPGRELTWIFNYGRAIAQIKFNDQSKALLMLNNYQLLLLLLFQRNNYATLKIAEVISEIKPEQQPALMASIMMLVKKGVLIKEGNPQKIQSKNETIKINFDLKLKTSKLGCFQVPRFVQKIPTVNNELNAERSFIIQANIVKLMKTKRILRYQQVISEVTAMCKTFKAQTGAIKNQIQNCIHRQLLQRDTSDFNMILYKP